MLDKCLNLCYNSLNKAIPINSIELKENAV